MKIDTKEATVESSMTFGNSVDMGIAADGVIHLMSLLTNLYNDPELAVIREYYTNALDSHVEAKQSRPVDIYLPSRDNPLFVVKDYGIGMSEDDIKTIYSQYGASTKRNTNEQVGAFGLGCKSALTIATQFTLTAVKNGIKTTALISKTESGINTVDILPAKGTDEINGVTVTIPVPDTNLFNSKVENFFKFSDPSKVLVNGNKPFSVLDNATLLTTDSDEIDVYVDVKTGGYSWNSTYKVIMGNVPYDLTKENVDESLRRLKDKYSVYDSGISVYFVVGIGDVDLTPSREGLRYTDKTKAFIDKSVKLYVENIRKAAQKEIDAVDDRAEVFNVAKKWSSIFPEGIKWRDADIPSYIKHDTDIKVVTRHGLPPYSDSKHSTVSRVHPASSAIFVYGRDPEEYLKVNNYISPYMAEKNMSHGYFYFIATKAEITDPWLTDNSNITFVDAEDLVSIGKARRKADRLAAKGTTGPAAKYAYIVMDLPSGDVAKVPYDKIAADTPYLHTEDFSNVSHNYFNKFFNGDIDISSNYDIDRSAVKRREYGKAISNFTPAKRVIIVGGSLKIDALQRRVPTTYNLADDYEKTIQKTFKDIPQAVKDIATVKTTTVGAIIKTLKSYGIAHLVADKDIQYLANPTKDALDTYESIISYQLHLKVLRPNNKSLTDIPQDSEKVNSVMEKYPLIKAMHVGTLDTSGTQHLVKYFNAIHEEELTPAL